MISPAEATALLIAITGLLGALVGVSQQIRGLSRRVDGRLTQLLELTEAAALAKGEKAGQELANVPSGTAPDAIRGHEKDIP